MMNFALSNLRVILLYSLLVHFVDCEDEAIKEEILHASSYADAYAKYENAFEPENNAWLGALSLNPEQRRKKEMKEKRKQQLFMRRLKSCNKHNKNFKEGISGFSETVNQFTVMEDDERMRYTGVDLNSTEFSDVAEFRVKRQTSNILTSDLPQSVDWVEKGYVTEPKSQKRCAASWAFSAMVPLEYAYKKITKNLISLSEQDLMDCVVEDSYPNRTGCDRGNLFAGMKYLKEAQSIASTEEYPYQAMGLPCRREEHTNVLANKFTITSINRVGKKSVEEVMSALSQHGPLAAFTATQDTYFAYSSGIFDGCQSESLKVTHAVAIVGYDTNTWLVKNSWGKKWGEDGYMRMKRRNICRMLDYNLGYMTVTKNPDYVPVEVPAKVPTEVPAEVPAEISAQNDELQPTSRCKDKGKESEGMHCVLLKNLGHCNNKNKIKMAKWCADTCNLCDFVDALKKKSIEQRQGSNKSNVRGGGRSGRRQNKSDTESI